MTFGGVGHRQPEDKGARARRMRQRHRARRRAGVTAAPMKRIQSQVVEVTVSVFNSSKWTTCGTVQYSIDFRRDGRAGTHETSIELTETEKSKSTS